jgi:hypothetical protein
MICRERLCPNGRPRLLCWSFSRNGIKNFLTKGSLGGVQLANSPFDNGCIEVSVANMASVGTINVYGGRRCQKGCAMQFVAAAAVILAGLIGAAATLYSNEKQMEAERRSREEVQRKPEIYQSRYENAPKAFVEQLGHLVDTAPRYQNVRGTDTRILNPDPEYRQSVSWLAPNPSSRPEPI